MKIIVIFFILAAFSASVFGEATDSNSADNGNKDSNSKELAEEQKQQIKELEDQISEINQDISRLSEPSKPTQRTLPQLESKWLEKRFIDQELSLEEVKKHQRTIDNYISLLKDLLAGAIGLREGDKRRLKTIPGDSALAKQSLALLHSNTVSQSALDQKILEAKIELSSRKITKLELEETFLTARISKNDRFIGILNEKVKKAEPIQKLWQERFTSTESEQLKLITVQLTNLKAKYSSSLELTFHIDKSIKIAQQFVEDKGLNEQLSAIRNSYESLEKIAKTLTKQEAYATNRLKLLKEADLPIDLDTGRVLRNQRASLPSAKSLSEELKRSTIESTSNDLTILDLEKSLSELPENLEEIKTSKGQISHFKSQLDTDFEVILSGISRIYEVSILKRLEVRDQQTKLQSLQKTTINQANDYSNFLNKKLMWIASHERMSLSDLKAEAAQISQLADPQFLKKWIKKTTIQLELHSFLWVPVFIAILVIFTLRKKIRNFADKQHDRAKGSYVLSSKYLWRGLISEIIFITPLPLLFFSLATLSVSTPILSSGFTSVSAVLFFSSLLKVLSKDDGFINANFNLERHQVAIMHKCFKLMQNFGAPLMFLHEVSTYSENLTKDGRIFTILALLFIALLLFIGLNPKRGIFAGLERSFSSCTLCSIFVGMPIVMAIISAVGYHHSSLLLMPQFIYTMRSILMILFLMLLAKSLLLFSRRRMAIASIKDDPKDPQASSENTQSRKENIKLKLDSISEINQQTSKLIDIAAIAAILISLWAIWSQTMPALRVLDDIKAWGPSTSVEQVDSPVSPLPSSQTPLTLPPESAELENIKTEKIASFISVQDVLMALAIALLTYLTAVNLPGLIELLILNRLRLKDGTGFGIKTVIQYLVVMIGVFWSFNCIGISWGKVQWLAAAISLGIGFGLQEIFANFVAGIILLFEKPIRIGDLVTVGEISGRVARIKIRATTILQFNNCELILPNKEFITGQLQNWTLSDTVMRAEIPVGIAYGSDTRNAEKLLYEVAKENPKVLTDPAPQVLFNAFGGSSLDFILRIFVASAEDLVPVQSEIHFAIDDEFRKAGIEISFPQQDIHIRSIDPLIAPQQA